MTFEILMLSIAVIFGGLIIANNHYYKLVSLDDKNYPISIYLVHAWISLVGLALSTWVTAMVLIKVGLVTL